MKNLLKLSLLILIFQFAACSDSDDGSTTTGNTDEYFKYTADGVERIFDYTIEGHKETQTNSNVATFEINASGQQPNGDLRRVAFTFFFDANGALLPTTSYPWGYPDPNAPTSTAYFAENTISNPFLLSVNYSENPIDVTITSAIPNNVGDYLEFSFTGMYTDMATNTMKTISGECRVQRDADQSF